MSFLTILIVSQAQDLVVSQPSSAQGIEGSSVTLRCSYNYTSKPKVGSYQWVKDPGLVVVKNSTPEFMGRLNCTSDLRFLLDQRADLELQDLRHYDSGIYRCVVSIYGVQEASGNGTKLQVMKAATGPGDVQLGDNMVLVWLILRGFLYTLGIAVVALLTHLHYRKTISQEVQKRQSYYTENEYRAATGNYSSDLLSSGRTKKLQLSISKVQTR
ncbi:natural cytotoxicity triggering receptor 3-like [Heteronotia binoei]|uniref:natural cytotoxicity triggering receptor 3-like n=1 Tax=Heteronotia binoei TaxID=13085 RepID=UPI00292E6573|nr:natural cytotoxicity triggering receptor 3-like [Heteronotia binoei]